MTSESDPAEASQRRSDGTDELSRRSTIGTMAATGFLGLASTDVSAAEGNGEGNDATPEVEVLPNPNFITNARGEAPPFDDDTPLFDPGPVSIPLNEVIGDDEHDSELFKPLNDGNHQVVRPPEGYDRETGYDEPWEPVTWGEYNEVGGVKPADGNGNGANDETGTRVDIEVEDGLANGQYTVWVVEFAALAEDSELGPDDPFVTPRGNALVGFHDLGQKFGDDD